ncbi:decaprenyl-phosphate phosphoribosyltransferase [Actinomadura sp. 3N407]|uniref:decaprenyl-phosphate phosphoribosyltransferase n=1 Tax=Actinomadura sp. 3N407 TaxID=3457423 RepID=UPI003FCECF5D
MTQVGARPHHPDPPASEAAHPNLGGAASGRGWAVSLIRACRPRQWLKNLLVFSALASSGSADDLTSVLRTVGAFLALCLAASGTYLVNDVRDVAADRLHPRKARRPVAAGRISVGAALTAAALLIALSLPAAAVAGGSRLVAAVACYLALATAYSIVLKHWPIVDLAAVAGCHVIRAVAGAVVIGVPASSWFLIVVSLMSLLLVVGKREAELALDKEGTRAALRAYSRGYLAQLRATLSGAVVVTYALWALDVSSMPGLSLRALSVVPFILMIMRLNLVMERGAAEEPEELVLRDVSLQIFLGLNVLCVVAGIYF